MEGILLRNIYIFIIYLNNISFKYTLKSKEIVMTKIGIAIMAAIIFGVVTLVGMPTPSPKNMQILATDKVGDKK